MPFELTRDYIDQLKELINGKEDTAALEMISELHPADIAEIFSELETELGQGNHVIQARRLAAKENLSIWVGT